MKSIIEILKSKVEESCRYEARRDYLSMSKIAECSRKLYLEMLNGTKPDYNTKARCWLGYHYEDLVVDWLQDEKLLVPQSRGKEISVFDGRFKGHIDGHDAQQVLIEIKSLSEVKFQSIKTAVKIPTRNFLQVQTYMFNGHFNRAMIIYVCRETMEFETRTINQIDSVGYRMNEKARRILTAFANSVMPDCDCGYCK